MPPLKHISSTNRKENHNTISYKSLATTQRCYTIWTAQRNCKKTKTTKKQENYIKSSSQYTKYISLTKEEKVEDRNPYWIGIRCVTLSSWEGLTALKNQHIVFTIDWIKVMPNLMYNFFFLINQKRQGCFWLPCN